LSSLESGTAVAPGIERHAASLRLKGIDGNVEAPGERSDEGGSAIRREAGTIGQEDGRAKERMES
jgi:hypothetical protein